jgi:hypothetical protein
MKHIPGTDRRTEEEMEEEIREGITEDRMLTAEDQTVAIGEDTLRIRTRKIRTMIAQEEEVATTTMLVTTQEGAETAEEVDLDHRREMEGVILGAILGGEVIVESIVAIPEETTHVMILVAPIPEDL